MRFPYARALAIGTGLMVVLAAATAHGQNQPPAKATVPVNVVIVIQTQPGSPGGSGTLALPGGVNITTMAVPAGAVRVGPIAVTPVKPVATTAPKPVSYKPEDRFGMQDIDKDGRLSRAEFKGPQNVFASIDADHNGFISKPEATRAYFAFVGRMVIEERAQRFKAMDLNHDGKLSATEFKGPEPRFARLDANHDGFITRAEAAKAFEDHVHHAMVVARYKSMDKNKTSSAAAKPIAQPLAPSTGPGRFLQRVLAALDINKDGKVSKCEYLDHAMRRFTRIDTNKDGILSEDELNAARAAIAARFRPDPASSARPATSAGRRPGVGLARYDTDKDGKVSKAEYTRGINARFTHLDVDKDGVITAADVAKVVQARGTRPTASQAPIARPAAPHAVATPAPKAAKPNPAVKG